MKIIQINRVKTKCEAIAFDGCQKIYICETEKDVKEAETNHYKLHSPKELQELWDESCSLRFVNSWDLKTIFVDQGGELYDFNY